APRSGVKPLALRSEPGDERRPGNSRDLTDLLETEAAEARPNVDVGREERSRQEIEEGRVAAGRDRTEHPGIARRLANGLTGGRARCDQCREPRSGNPRPGRSGERLGQRVTDPLDHPRLRSPQLLEPIELDLEPAEGAGGR